MLRASIVDRSVIASNYVAHMVDVSSAAFSTCCAVKCFSIFLSIDRREIGCQGFDIGVSRPGYGITTNVMCFQAFGNWSNLKNTV